MTIDDSYLQIPTLNVMQVNNVDSNFIMNKFNN